MNNLFDEQGWKIAGPVGSDASLRIYTRVEKNGHTAIIMDARQSPPGEVEQFIHVAEYLRANGLRAPKIYGREGQVLLIEDFGETKLRDVEASRPESRDPELHAPGSPLSRGCQILEQFSELTRLPPLPEFFSSPLFLGHRRVLDWYVPLAINKPSRDAVLKTYLTIWGEVLKVMPPPHMGFVHGDFHLDNLMLLPGGDVGILDFQGAVYGPLAYDAVNLFDDARAGTPPEREDFLAGKDENFRRWYDVLALVFHSRVIGQFIKLAAQGKPDYLQHVPRLEKRMQAHLQKPEFTELAEFFKELGVDFSGVKDFNEDRIKDLVRPDAY